MYVNVLEIFLFNAFIFLYFNLCTMHKVCCLLTIYILLFSLGNTIEGLCFLASSKSIEQ